MKQTARLFGFRAICLSALVIAVGAGLTGCESHVSDRDITLIELAEVRKLASSDKPEKVRFVDPRSAEEFAVGHIPGAMNVQLYDVSGRKGDLEPSMAKAEWVVVYGDDPGTAIARAMTKRLLAAGQDGTRLFAGGLSAWAASGMPVEKGGPVGTPKKPAGQ